MSISIQKTVAMVFTPN